MKNSRLNLNQFLNKKLTEKQSKTIFGGDGEDELELLESNPPKGGGMIVTTGTGQIRTGDEITKP